MYESIRSVGATGETWGMSDIRPDQITAIVKIGAMFTRIKCTVYSKNCKHLEEDIAYCPHNNVRIIYTKPKTTDKSHQIKMKIPFERTRQGGGKLSGAQCWRRARAQHFRKKTKTIRKEAENHYRKGEDLSTSTSQKRTISV